MTAFDGDTTLLGGIHHLGARRGLTLFFVAGKFDGDASFKVHAKVARPPRFSTLPADPADLELASGPMWPTSLWRKGHVYRFEIIYRKRPGTEVLTGAWSPAPHRADNPRSSRADPALKIPIALSRFVTSPNSRRARSGVAPTSQHHANIFKARAAGGSRHPPEFKGRSAAGGSRPDTANSSCGTGPRPRRPARRRLLLDPRADRPRVSSRRAPSTSPRERPVAERRVRIREPAGRAGGRRGDRTTLGPTSGSVHQRRPLPAAPRGPACPSCASWPARPRGARGAVQLVADHGPQAPLGDRLEGRARRPRTGGAGRARCNGSSRAAARAAGTGTGRSGSGGRRGPGRAISAISGAPGRCSRTWTERTVSKVPSRNGRSPPVAASGGRARPRGRANVAACSTPT